MIKNMNYVNSQTGKQQNHAKKVLTKTTLNFMINFLLFSKVRLVCKLLDSDHDCKIWFPMSTVSKELFYENV